MTTGQVCVYCRNRAIALEWKPFCSERCKQLDLRNWVDGRYRVPGDATTAPDSDNQDQPG
ncbi:MAG: DNA gyrase inhibitor YacG [Acidobacteriota bacterium]|nr:DNA gyrase inhibitor YacG [Acidobacteriota bacterium]